LSFIILQPHLVQRLALQDGACVDENIEAPRPLSNLRDSLLNSRHIAQITTKGPMLRSQLSSYGCKRVGRNVQHCHAAPFERCAARRRAPDAAGCPRHQGYTPLQTQTHGWILPVVIWSDHYLTTRSVPRQAQTRIAVLAGYMAFFDSVMPADFRAVKNGWGAARAQELAGLGQVFYSGLIDGFASARRVASELAAFDPHVLVFMPTMAAPAGYQWEAVRELGRRPTVILNLHELEQVEADYVSQSIVAHSANVGCMMINNILRRHGWPAAVVTGRVGEPATAAGIQAAVQSAAVAGRLRRARFGILGAPIEGYINVTCDAGQLRDAVGCELVDIPLQEWLDTYRGASTADIAELADRLSGSCSVAVTDAEEFTSSVRLCVALEQITQRHGLDGGTFNCRHEFGVENPGIGLLGCLANSYLTTTGVPFTCTGDTITAIAMFLGKNLGGDALYCELDTVDYSRDAVLCANTGEGDFCQAAARPCIRASGKESGRKSRGCSVFYEPTRGAATAIAFTPRLDAKGGHMILAAQGEFTDVPPTSLHLPHAMFKFQSGPVADAISRWIASGPTHHVSLSSGALAAPLREVANHLNIGFESI
jgi:L-arabinose isomerase